jgi:hypothetical protein
VWYQEYEKLLRPHTRLEREEDYAPIDYVKNNEKCYVLNLLLEQSITSLK